MLKNEDRSHLLLEVALVIVVLGLTALLAAMVNYKMIVLNLFFLPVVLAGFYLGRYRAGILALLAVIAAGTATFLDLANFAAMSTPLVVGLGVTVWGAVLGLTAIMIGTLSDERNSKIRELHDAYVGVVEVLSRYLQSPNVKLKARSHRVAELSHRVAHQMGLSAKAADDVRVAALLNDIGNMEITARAIRRAVGNLEAERTSEEAHTFEGTDLVQSLASVLRGAFPLVVGLDESPPALPSADEDTPIAEAPLGAKIIRATRAYYDLREGDPAAAEDSPDEIISRLRQHPDQPQVPELWNALSHVVAKSDGAAALAAV